MNVLLIAEEFISLSGSHKNKTLICDVFSIMAET